MHTPSTSVNFTIPPPPVEHQSSPPEHQQSEQQTPPPPPPQRSHQSGSHHQSYPHYQRHYHGGYSGKSGQQHFRSYNNFNRGHGGMVVQDDFDGKRLRKSVMRKTVDYNSSIVRALEVCTHTFEKKIFNRLWLTNFF